MLTRLEKRMVVLTLVVISGVVAFWICRVSFVAPAPPAVSANHNPYLRWDATGKGIYSLTVAHNQPYIQGVNVPPAPGDGQVHIVGGKWTVKPGNYVSVTNLRSKEMAETTADGNGAFAVNMPANSGDSFQVFSVQQLRIRPAMQPMAAGQPPSPDVKH